MAMFPSVIDLSDAPSDVITVFLGNMSLEQRFTCALACSDWANTAAAATHSIVKDRLQDLIGLQQWLEKNGSHVETLQLHVCRKAGMAMLPCPQLQDLLPHGKYLDRKLVLDSRVWSDIAAATKLTSVSLQRVCTDSQQADVVSALTALPDLQQLTWQAVRCGQQERLSDSRLLQQLTKLAGMQLDEVSAEVLQHLGSLSKLQHLSISGAKEWAAANCPGLQRLTALTSLQLDCPMQGFAVSISYLTALQQLQVSEASPTELNGLMALTALTELRVAYLTQDPTPLQLPALHHLDLSAEAFCASKTLHTSQLSGCTQLRQLALQQFHLVGPYSLVASSMLQELFVSDCTLSSSPEGPACDQATAVHPWQLVFPGPGRLPHLTSAVLLSVSPVPQQADFERLVACCSGLRVLKLYFARSSWRLTSESAFQCLSRLASVVSLHLSTATDQQCSSLAQLTGLQELEVLFPEQLSPVGLRHLARLQSLTRLRFRGVWDSCKVSAVLQAQLSDRSQGSGCTLVNKAPPGSPPDVSARLLRAYDMAAGDQQQ